MTTSCLIVKLRAARIDFRDRRILDLIAAACMILSAIFLIYHEVVFSGKTIVPVNAVGVMGTTGAYGFTPALIRDYYHPDLGASGWVSEPLSREVASEYASGRWPLWNKNEGFGSPLLANGQSGAMDVLRLPVLLGSSALAWDFYYLLRALIGGIAAYVFARLLGLVWSASVFFANAYIFSGHFMFLGNNTWVEAYFLLPVILAGTELVATKRLRLGFLVLAISVCLCILVGMPEVTLLVCLTSAGYGAYRLFIVRQPVGSWRLVLTRTVHVVGAWLLGIALAAPLLATLLEFAAQSSSIASNRSSYGLFQESWTEFVFFFVPYLVGKPLEKGAGNLITTYMGATVLILALYGLFPSPSKVYRKIVPFWAFATALIIAKMFGAPGFNELGKLPLLNVTLILHWSAPIACFGLALLAAFGVHRLVVEDTHPWAASHAILLLLGMTLLGVYVNLDKLTNQTAEHYRDTVGVAILFALVVWALMQVRRFLPGWIVGFGCCVAVVLELFIYAPHGVYQSRYDPFVEAPYVRFLQQSTGGNPVRIFGADAIMFPNFASAFGLEDIRSLDALYLDRYLLYIQNFIAPGVTDRYTGAPFVDPEQPTRILDNPWFDLTGVRYIITGRGSQTGSLLHGGLAERVVASDSTTGECPGRGRPCVAVEPITIDGVTKPMLEEHPPASTKFPLAITPTQDDLQFSIALNPLVWDPSKGDGVGFEIDVESDGRREVLFHKEIDPKNSLSDRHWIDGHVDLSRFIGRQISIILTTDPLKSSASDWAGWGDLRLGALSPSGGQLYPRVYADEVEIYQNNRALPRAFLVTSITPTSEPASTVAEMKRGSVDPSRTAIVEGLSKGPVPILSPTPGTVRVRSNNSLDTVLEVNTEGASFLVFTESFYPGWSASVNGRATPIYATDLAFQGIFVPEGNSVVTFSYRPTSFYIGGAISLAATVILILVSTGVLRIWSQGRCKAETANGNGLKNSSVNISGDENAVRG